MIQFTHHKTLHRLYAKQELPIKIKEAWDFLSNPKNLATITPDHMKFKVKTKITKKMYSGQIIQYNVCPFPFIKSSWITEITHLKEGIYFVDEQRFGPYAFWHHKHFLKETLTGTLMEDIVDYKLPFGKIGNLAAPLVQKKLKQIFNYRKEKLEKLFQN